MHKKVLPKGGSQLLDKIESLSLPVFEGWTLAGGTALALEIAHRISIDFDFFKTEKFSLDEFHNALSRLGEYETLQEDENTLTVLLSDIKFSFFSIKVPFIYESKSYKFFSLANIKDIALMKLIAISGRGSRKDFVDLYFILRRGYLLHELFSAIPEKYGKSRGNVYHILKSLTYFDDAETEPMPTMLEPFDWNECKKFLVRQAHSIVL